MFSARRVHITRSMRDALVEVGGYRMELRGTVTLKVRRETRTKYWNFQTWRRIVNFKKGLRERERERGGGGGGRGQRHWLC